MYKLPTLQPIDAVTLLRRKCAHAVLFVGCANADTVFPGLARNYKLPDPLGVPCDACHLLMTSLPNLPSSPATSLWPAAPGSFHLPRINSMTRSCDQLKQLPHLTLTILCGARAASGKEKATHKAQLNQEPSAKHTEHSLAQDTSTYRSGRRHSFHQGSVHLSFCRLVFGRGTLASLDVLASFTSASSS